MKREPPWEIAGKILKKYGETLIGFIVLCIFFIFLGIAIFPFNEEIGNFFRTLGIGFLVLGMIVLFLKIYSK